MKTNATLRKLMKRAKLTQSDVARLLYVDRSAVNHWINDRRECPMMAVDLLERKIKEMDDG